MIEVYKKTNLERLGYYPTVEAAKRRLSEFVELRNAMPLIDKLEREEDYAIEVSTVALGEAITNYERASEYLGLKYEKGDMEAGRISAFDTLTTLQRAWNTECGFKVDWDDFTQPKWYPMFIHDKREAMFKCMGSFYAYNNIHGYMFCFKTKEIAEQFGRMFQREFNRLFI